MGPLACSQVRRLSVKEPSWIHRGAMDSNFVMEVRTRRAAACTDGADDFALLDLLPNHHEYSAEVRVAGRDSIAVIDQNASAVACIGFGLNDQTITGRHDVRTIRVGNVDAWVKGLLAAEGVHPLTKSRG